ncbi:glycosyltransferase family 2 protein [Amaricoccus sp. B4]|uniref:glycosyltransferase family 2 protein n=1 Tax=Amaricoccus sp. B4 TaxID=3368557 RepID=UPI00371720BD
MAASMELPSEGPWLSIVIPAKNESGNIELVVEGIVSACAAYAPFEIIYVDDGSTDDTAAKVLEMAGRHPFVRLIRHGASGGQSAAVHTGVLAARGYAICTLDADGQNPPSEIPKLLARLDGRAFPEGVAVVAGERVGRKDTASKRWASKAANALRQKLLNDGTRDTGCGLKLFRRDAFLAFPYFDHMHRYLPALAIRDGWTVLHADVAHAPRHAGSSNYANLGRALVGVYDLIGVVWLLKRRKKVRGIEAGDE